jgi:hypothetical protein
MKTNRQQITDAAFGLSQRDFGGFAARIKLIDKVLAKTVELHADAADGNSPDLVPSWIDGTLEDAEALAKNEITTRAAASVYWTVRYGPDDDSMTEEEARKMFRAVYGREADEADGHTVSEIYSHVCAGVRL